MLTLSRAPATLCPDRRSRPPRLLWRMRTRETTMLRLAIGFTLCAGAAGLAIPVVEAQDVASGSPDLYRSAGCVRCHGVAASGDFGPALAGIDLSFEDFLGQLRSPRERMPSFGAGALSDEEALCLFDYLRALQRQPADATARSCRCGHHHRADGACGCSENGCDREGGCRHGACRHQGASRR